MKGLYKITEETDYMSSYEVNIDKIDMPFFKALFIYNFSGYKKINYLLWRLISLGKSVLYYAHKDGKILGTSLVVYRCFKFRYMKKNEYEIGPCVVNSDFRGKGIYPTMLINIINDNKQKEPTMIIDDNNISSINGVKKVGFNKVNTLSKSKFLKIYIGERNNE